MSESTNAWSRVTCDMTDSEFCAWVRERCEMTLKNTAAGVYMQGLIDRLLKSEAELLTAEQTAHKWFKVSSDRRFEIERLETETERLRDALKSIERRASGRGNGAEVAVTTQTLGAIARGTLKGGGGDE